MIERSNQYSAGGPTHYRNTDDHPVVHWMKLVFDRCTSLESMYEQVRRGGMDNDVGAANDVMANRTDGRMIEFIFRWHMHYSQWHRDCGPQRFRA